MLGGDAETVKNE